MSNQMPDLSSRLIRTPIKLQASHAVEVVRSDGHLSASNVEGEGSVPPPFSQGKRQDSTGRPLRHQMDNEPETHSTNMAPSLLSQDRVPHQDSTGATLTRIWG